MLINQGPIPEKSVPRHPSQRWGHPEVILGTFNLMNLNRSLENDRQRDDQLIIIQFTVSWFTIIIRLDVPKFIFSCSTFFCSTLESTKAPSWRPSFKYYHWSLSLLGAGCCLTLIFLTSGKYKSLPVNDFRPK